MHPSIKMMVKNMSAIRRNKAGELSKNFLSIYITARHTAVLKSIYTSCSRMQAWETLFF